MINAAVYEKLIEVAKSRGTITFADVGRVADMSLDGDGDIKALGFVLDEIADQETAAGRPLLPVLVAHGTNNMPGAGLFEYARRKGLQKTDDLTFFATERNRVYAHWAPVRPPGRT